MSTSGSGNRGRGGIGRARGKARVKRQEVQSEDGWTVITHGLSKVSIDGKKEKKGKEVAGLLPSRTVEGLTAQKLHLEFEKLQERWKDTAVATQIEELLSGKRWDVDTAVCVGIGSFSRDWEHRWRSMWQLVLFLGIIQHLNKNDKKVRIYAQDPAFTPIDMDFLTTLNVSTIPSAVESHISPKSFVYSPFVDWYILLPTFLKDKDPVLYMGNEILDDYTPYAQGEDKKEKLEMCNELGKSFLEKREGVKIREFDAHAHALEGMRCYWKTALRRLQLEKVPQLWILH